MSPQRKREVATWITILVGAVTLGVSARAWANSAYVTDKRFTADSTRRETDHDILQRLDGRVSDIYCATVPPERRKGCR